MKKVGIFGGSFNPIHTGHIALAKSLCEKAGLDEVWFMVSPMNPFKKAATDLLDDHLRLEMVEKALENEPQLKACDYEFRLPSLPIPGTLCRPSARIIQNVSLHY